MQVPLLVLREFYRFFTRCRVLVHKEHDEQEHVALTAPDELQILPTPEDFFNSDSCELLLVMALKECPTYRMEICV